jgi:hypothetical protein
MQNLEPFENVKECLEYLFQEPNTQVERSVSKGIKQIINNQDPWYRGQNTALHYAGRKWSQDIIMLVLKSGANIGIRNSWDEPAFANVSSNVLEEFFDDCCLKTSWHDKDGDARGELIQYLYDKNEALEIIFDYAILLPFKEEQTGTNTDVGLGGSQISLNKSNYRDNMVIGCPLPEANTLMDLSKSSEHQRLLKHPLIMSFVWFKLLLMRRTFNRNLRFFSFFVFLLTWYIITQYGFAKPCVSNRCYKLNCLK